MGQMSGYNSINDDGSFQLLFELVEDNKSERNEKFNVSIYSPGDKGVFDKLVLTDSLSINDTSTEAHANRWSSVKAPSYYEHLISNAEKAAAKMENLLLGKIRQLVKLAKKIKHLSTMI